MRWLVPIALAACAAGIALAAVPHEPPQHAAAVRRHARPKEKAAPLRRPQRRRLLLRPRMTAPGCGVLRRLVPDCGQGAPGGAGGECGWDEPELRLDAARSRLGSGSSRG